MGGLISPVIFLLVSLWINYLCVCVVSEKQYPLKAQPEFDRYDIKKYFTNERLMQLQFGCLMFDGPCDIVGKFIKPRIKAGLAENAECLKCTAFQEQLMHDFLELFRKRFPEMYKAAVKKYIELDGKELSPEFLAELKKIFNQASISQFLAEFSDEIKGYKVPPRTKS